MGQKVLPLFLLLTFTCAPSVAPPAHIAVGNSTWRFNPEETMIRTWGRDHLTSIDGIERLPLLENLVLSRHRGIRDFTPLARLTRLEVLGVAYTNFSDVTILRGLRLRRLDLSGSQVISLDTICESGALETLSIADTAVPSLAPLKACSKLRVLLMPGVNAADFELLPGALEKLKVTPTAANQRELAKLRRERPALEIVEND